MASGRAESSGGVSHVGVEQPVVRAARASLPLTPQRFFFLDRSSLPEHVVYLASLQ